MAGGCGAIRRLRPQARQMGLLLLDVIGAYLPNAMFQDTNIIDGVNLLLFFVAGIASGLAARSPRQTNVPEASFDSRAYGRTAELRGLSDIRRHVEFWQRRVALRQRLMMPGDAESRG